MNPYAFRLDIEYSLPYPTVSGRYYWTNTYYWRGPSPAPQSPADTNNARLLALNSVSRDVTVELTRITSAFGTGAYFQQIAIPTPGNRIVANRALIGSAARLRAVSSGSALWYKPLRGLLAPEDIAGGMLSDAALAWLDDAVVPRIGNFQQLVNYRDVTVGAIEIDQLVHSWQLRHGTLRRARHVLTY